jgi:hypothetical protein
MNLKSKHSLILRTRENYIKNWYFGMTIIPINYQLYLKHEIVKTID